MSLFEEIKSEYNKLYLFNFKCDYNLQPGDNRAIGNIINKTREMLKREGIQKPKSPEILSRAHGIITTAFLYMPDWVRKPQNRIKFPKLERGKQITITLRLVNQYYNMISSTWYAEWNKKTNYSASGDKKVSRTKHSQAESVIGSSVNSLLKEITPFKTIQN